MRENVVRISLLIFYIFAAAVTALVVAPRAFHYDAGTNYAVAGGIIASVLTGVLVGAIFVIDVGFFTLLVMAVGAFFGIGSLYDALHKHYEAAFWALVACAAASFVVVVLFDLLISAIYDEEGPRKLLKNEDRTVPVGSEGDTRLQDPAM
jgi:hypothetical protein